MSSVLLSRTATLERLTYEPHTGRDGQGAPSYGTSTSFSAKVHDSEEVIQTGGGQEVRVRLTLWVPGSQSNVPGEDDRITRNGTTFIVLEEKRVRHLRTGAVVHTRLRCRDE